MLLSQADSSFFIWLVQGRRLASACVSRCELCRRGVWLHVQTLYDFVFRALPRKMTRPRNVMTLMIRQMTHGRLWASSLPE